MSRTVDYSKLVPVDAMRGDDEQDTKLLRHMAKTARSYLESFRWCGGIRKQFFGIGVGGIAAVFLFEIETKSDAADQVVWVVVGDLPPAYLVTDNAPNPARALDAYIGEMSGWVEAVEKGRSTEHVMPVNAEPTAENASQLKNRLAFLDREILSQYRDDLT